MTIYPDPEPGELIKFDDAQVDDDPQLIVSLARSSIAYLLRGLDELKQPEMWAGSGEDVSDAVGFIQTLAGRLLEEIELPTQQFTAPITQTWVTLSETAVPCTIHFNAAEYFGGYTYQTTPIDNRVVYKFFCYLPAGSYILRVWLRKIPNGGILTAYANGATPYSLGSLDTYSLTPAGNQYGEISFVITGGGNVQILLGVDGKNASSSDYYIVLHGVEIVADP